MAREPIEVPAGCQAVAGDQPGVYGIGLGHFAVEAGKQAGAATMGAMDGEPGLQREAR
ncbi:hypothetical protein [Pelagibacterium sp.]|uniref:hypothetical protein n=1 Tax=Pelagibacterium sp. TaxID=1967288 RepID=UPI003BABDA75